MIARTKKPKKPSDVRYVWKFNPTMNQLIVAKRVIGELTIGPKADNAILHVLANMHLVGLWLEKVRKKAPTVVIINQAATFVFGERLNTPAKVIGYRLAMLASGLAWKEEMLQMPVEGGFEKKYPLKRLLAALNNRIATMRVTLSNYNEE